MPTIAASPAYAQIAEVLRREILAREWPADSQLPTEREMCLRFNTSRITIRQALAILEDEQLIQRRQGRGTFVSPLPTRKIPIRHSDFVTSIAAHAPEISRRVERWCWRRATDEIAALLGILRGSRVKYALRLDELDGQPVSYDEVYLIDSLAENLTEDDFSQIDFVSAWLRKHTFTIAFATQRIEAVAADPAQGRRLKVRTGSPLLKNVDLLHGSGHEPIAAFTSLYRHDLFHMTATVNEPDVRSHSKNSPR